MYTYCQARGFEMNVLGGDAAPVSGGVACSATPFGVMQRIAGLKDFTLDGGAMRRLRYQVQKFEKAGACKTEEYRCGSDAATAADIARVIDEWCATKSMVNPLVHDARREILAGPLPAEHPAFPPSPHPPLPN